MRILLIGCNGQVGWELQSALRGLGEVIACDRAALDLADRDAVVARTREVSPSVIVNAAAYTAVDKAESEPGKAYAVNAHGPALLAEEAKRLDALLVHYSTDYVFDGTKDGPYVEDDAPNPLNVYGASKLAGEQAIRASGCRHLILRTCWVYGTRGRNFLLTILDLAANRSELRIVDDQIGSPTWSRTIALATAELLKIDAAADAPLVHLAGSGYTSWYGFADEIVRRTRELRSRQPVVTPIASGDYPTPARRPRNSRLATGRLTALIGRPLPSWQDSLAECLACLDAP